MTKFRALLILAAASAVFSAAGCSFGGDAFKCAMEDPRCRTYTWAVMLASTAHPPVSVWVVLPPREVDVTRADAGPLLEGYWAFSRDRRTCWVPDWSREGNSSADDLRSSRLPKVVAEASALFERISTLDEQPDVIFLSELDSPSTAAAREQVLQCLGTGWEVAEGGLVAARRGALPSQPSVNQNRP